MRLFVLLDEESQIQRRDVINLVQPRATPANFALLPLNKDLFPPQRITPAEREIVTTLIAAEAERVMERYRDADCCIAAFQVANNVQGLHVPVEWAYILCRNTAPHQQILNLKCAKARYRACPMSRGEAVTSLQALLAVQMSLVELSV